VAYGPQEAWQLMSTGSFPGVRRSARGVEQPPQCSTEVIERAELYLYSISGTSWPVLGWILLTSHGRTFLKQNSVRTCLTFRLSFLMVGTEDTHTDPATPHFTISTYVLLLHCCKKHNSLMLAARLRHYNSALLRAFLHELYSHSMNSTVYSLCVWF
jgi:hypothetical protein